MTTELLNAAAAICYTAADVKNGDKDVDITAINCSASLYAEVLYITTSLAKGGYVFGRIGLSVCLFVNNITQKVMNGL